VSEREKEKHHGTLSDRAFLCADFSNYGCVTCSVMANGEGVEACSADSG